MDFPLWAMVATATSPVIKNCRCHLVNAVATFRVFLSVIILHKGDFVSLEQLQSGALPSHKHPIFSENRYKGPYIPGENNMSVRPHLMLWQQIYYQCKGRAKRGHAFRLITGDFRVWFEPHHRRTAALKQESRYLVGPLSALRPSNDTEAGCRSGLRHSPISRDGVSARLYREPSVLLWKKTERRWN